MKQDGKVSLTNMATSLQRVAARAAAIEFANKLAACSNVLQRVGDILRIKSCFLRQEVAFLSEECKRSSVASLATRQQGIGELNHSSRNNDNAGEVHVFRPRHQRRRSEYHRRARILWKNQSMQHVDIFISSSLCLCELLLVPQYIWKIGGGTSENKKCTPLALA